MPTAFSNTDKWKVIVWILQNNPFFPRVRTTWGSVMDKSVDKVPQINLLNLKVLKSDRDEFQISKYKSEKEWSTSSSLLTLIQALRHPGGSMTTSTNGNSTTLFGRCPPSTPSSSYPQYGSSASHDSTSLNFSARFNKSWSFVILCLLYDETVLPWIYEIWHNHAGCAYT